VGWLLMGSLGGGMGDTVTAPIWGLSTHSRHPHCRGDDYFRFDCIGGYRPTACSAGAGRVDKSGYLVRRPSCLNRHGNGDRPIRQSARFSRAVVIRLGKLAVASGGCFGSSCVSYVTRPPHSYVQRCCGGKWAELHGARNENIGDNDRPTLLIEYRPSSRHIQSSP